MTAKAEKAAITDRQRTGGSFVELDFRRQGVERSFEDLLERANTENFRFHDRHTFTSWYMMNGGDLYEFAKVLGHSNIKITGRYAKLAREHIAYSENRQHGSGNLEADEQEKCDRANIG